MPGCYGGSPNSYFSGVGGFVTVGPQPLDTVMDYLPVFVDLKNAPCLIVGAGSVAARKAGLLLRAGARVTLVAPDAGEETVALQEAGSIRHVAANFSPSMLDGQRLVIAASNDQALNRQAAAAARQAGVWCNVVDDREHCDFILPAIVDRDPVVVAFSTGGRAPVLAQWLKSRLEASLPARIGALAERAARWRHLVKKRFATLAERRRFWQRFFDGPIAADLLAGRTQQAERAMRRELLDGRSAVTGRAAIVGAGPGDPGLLTLRAQQLIRTADVILHDRLLSPEVLDMARKEALLIPVGKEGGGRSTPQETTTALLLRHVRAGRSVCRLKGGDPFVFGRGGEEAAALAAAGLPFEIVPGVSAALGCAAYAGIPLTLRGVSASVTLATASLQDDDEPDWAVLARPGQTLALYMSLHRLQQSARELIRHGLRPLTPAAVVASGTTMEQQVVTAPLAGIAKAVAEAGVSSPAILFVGDTVAEAQRLHWFTGNARPAVANDRQAAATRRAVAFARRATGHAALPADIVASRHAEVL
jgi:uroporphyrin-III C-methyltransferase / precorrin-2 dehydrogenase / sirohydrochlorin ferrochelatase